MTADELQRIALGLSNSGWCRYWLNFNHPQNPRTMAIQVVDLQSEENIGPVKVHGLEVRGFTLLQDSHFVYTIDRTNEDGTPFVSEL